MYTVLVVPINVDKCIGITINAELLLEKKKKIHENNYLDSHTFCLHGFLIISLCHVVKSLFFNYSEGNNTVYTLIMRPDFYSYILKITWIYLKKYSCWYTNWYKKEEGKGEQNAEEREERLWDI